MKRAFFVPVFKKKNVCLVAIFCFFLSGCTSGYVRNDIFGETVLTSSVGREYRKKAFFLPVRNESYFKKLDIGDDIGCNFSRQLLANCPDVLLNSVDSSERIDFFKFISEKKISTSDFSELLRFGRECGFIAVVFQDIQIIDFFKKNVGFFYFKKSKYFFKVRMTVTVLDTITGSVLSKFTKESQSKGFCQKTFIEFDESSDSVPQPLHDLLVNVSGELGALAGREISNQRWTARINSVSDARVSMAVGSDVGIREGDTFAVLTARCIRSDLTEQAYFVPDSKIGLIRIDEVDLHSAKGTFTGSKIPKVNDFLVSVE